MKKKSHGIQPVSMRMECTIEPLLKYFKERLLAS